MQTLLRSLIFFFHILFCYSNDEAYFARSYTFLEADFVLENGAAFPFCTSLHNWLFCQQMWLCLTNQSCNLSLQAVGYSVSKSLIGRIGKKGKKVKWTRFSQDLEYFRHQIWTQTIDPCHEKVIFDLDLAFRFKPDCFPDKAAFPLAMMERGQTTPAHRPQLTWL